jgi:hypothetical protein
LELPSLLDTSKEDEECNGLASPDIGDLTWKKRYQLSREWQWETSSTGKSAPLKVHSMCRTVSRPSQEGINPIVRTTKPFTSYRNFIEIIVEEVGTWFRCGVADTAVALDDGNLLGGQTNSFNIGYCKSGSIYYHFSGRMDKKSPSTDLRKRVSPGCRVGIHYDIEHKQFHFFFNGQLIQSLEFTHDSDIPSQPLYPTVQLSYSTRITIHHRYCHRESNSSNNNSNIATKHEEEACADFMDVTSEEVDASSSARNGFD